jgi:hypothetical protein
MRDECSNVRSRIRDLGRLPIRGRADGIDVVGIDDRNGTPESIAAKPKAYDQGGG